MFAEPEIEKSLRGWRNMDESRETMTQSISAVDINGYIHQEMYEDMELRESLYEGTMGNFDATVRVFSAGKVNLDPSVDQLPFGVGQSKILDNIESNAKSEFKREMRNQDLQNVRETRSTQTEFNDGTDVRATRYAADFRYPSMTVPLEGMDDITIEGGSLRVGGLLAVWHNGTDALIAGGAYPAEPFEESIKREVTDLVTVTIDIDLQLEPQRYARELGNLIASVE